MKLFDTAKNAYVKFEPGHVVKVYVCGITPYDSAHLGHIFTFMTYDLLQRRLEDSGHEVQMVRNITDVDEPIYARAQELGIHYTELAENEIISFRETLQELNFKPLFAEPRASQYIAGMIQAIEQLVTSGVAYYVDKDLYYDVSTFAGFGSFSGYTKHLQMAFMQNRGGDPERAGKRNPFDFLLWKSVTNAHDPAQWDAPFGSGRPGWHIECTVMSQQLLGIPFDIHGGGTDLIFPHHECEITQSYGLGKKNPARHWVHVSPMLYAGEKMSKSLGNLVFAKDLLKQYDSATIRLALMFYHHRIGGEWQPELLDHAQQMLYKLQKSIENASKAQALTLVAEIRAALDDDLNTLEVIDAMHRFIANAKTHTTNSTEVKVYTHKAYEILGLAVEV